MRVDRSIRSPHRSERAIAKRSVSGIALASIAASGCTGGGAAAPEVTDVREQAPIDTTDVFVELPPAPDAAGTPTEQLALGAWDWGAPCSVPVREEISGDGERVVRTYTVDLAVDPETDGYVMAFDDVVVDDRFLDVDTAAEAVFGYLAVLADMRLASDGRFVEFVDLEHDLTEAADRAGHTSPGGLAADLARQPAVAATILDRTIMGWYGFWLESDRLPLNPVVLEAERVREGPAGSFRATTTAFASPVHSDGRWGRSDGPGRWFTYIERASDGESGRVDVNAVADPTNRRPAHVLVSVDDFSVAGRVDLATTDRRVTHFDWEHAEGCV